MTTRITHLLVSPTEMACGAPKEFYTFSRTQLDGPYPVTCATCRSVAMRPLLTDDEYERVVVERILGRYVCVAMLRSAFERVVPSNHHWKDAINARVVVADDFDLLLIRSAVIFFTGSVPRLTALGDNRYHVTAAGYYRTIGA